MSYKPIPILFIPGLFGCMSSEIIPHTGAWQFGFAKSMYTPFFETLKAHGIDAPTHIFTLFYDWRKSTAYNVKTYLVPILKKIKKLTGSSELHILAHGTGGYLARYYLQKPTVPIHIQNLILLGTPNAGFTTAFSYLTGGELALSCGAILDFTTLYLRMHLYKNIPHRAILPDYFKKAFPALYEMIPSDLYGDYLFYLYQHGQYFLPYQSMVAKNSFLDQLNHSPMPAHPPTTIHLIAGEGYATIQHFEVMPLCCGKSWVDGKVLNCIYTPEGDGVSTIHSVFAIDGHRHVINSSYDSLLVDAAPIYIPLIF